MNERAYQGSVASDLFATTFAAAGKEMPKGPKPEVLRELAGEWEELDEKTVEAEFRQ